MERERADILVLGAGASGAAAAWYLVRAGFRVVCLEQGSWQAREQHVTTSMRWEEESRTAPDRPENYPINTRESPLVPKMFSAVGGTTIQWTAQAPRFHPSDFRTRSLDGVGDDWPIGYRDLEPLYDLNDQMMGCSGIHGELPATDAAAAARSRW
jgi:choline dehydrogenase-like flavoprotein